MGNKQRNLPNQIQAFSFSFRKKKETKKHSLNKCEHKDERNSINKTHENKNFTDRLSLIRMSIINLTPCNDYNGK